VAQRSGPVIDSTLPQAVRRQWIAGYAASNATREDKLIYSAKEISRCIKDCLKQR
jgi:hypothetical protein